MTKYIIQPSSTQPDSWVLTDTTHGIVVKFADGKFNETQHVTVLDDMPTLNADEWAHAMRELGEWAVRHHSSKCFNGPYGLEYSEDNATLYLYRRNPPRWRMEVPDGIDARRLANSLKKAAEWLLKR